MHPASKSEPMLTDLEICYGRHTRKYCGLGVITEAAIQFCSNEGSAYT